jgi:hypothetical protein
MPSSVLIAFESTSMWSEYDDNNDIVSPTDEAGNLPTTDGDSEGLTPA